MKKNYADARATCRGAPGGGDLVTVDSAEMLQFVTTQLEGYGDDIWLGVKEGEFYISGYYYVATFEGHYVFNCKKTM